MILNIPSIATRGLLESTKRFIFLEQRRGFRNAKLAYVPRRAMMFVPGSDERKLKKIPQLGCDCVCLDMEDGVAQNRKQEARDGIVKALADTDFSSVADVAVRINSVSSGLIEDDLVALVASDALPMTLMVPKVDSCEDALWFANALTRLFKNRDLTKPFRLIIFTESAAGLLELTGILARLQNLSYKFNEKEGAPYVLEGVVFGSDDYVASIGATRTPDAKELLYARQKIVLNAKAFDLQAIDLVQIDFKDLGGLKTQSEEGFRMGFTGKQVIHPPQIPVVQAAFTPNLDTRKWAQGLIDAFEEHQESGKGAFIYQDKMIDMPLLRQAQNIVCMCQGMGIEQTS